MRGSVKILSALLILSSFISAESALGSTDTIGTDGIESLGLPVTVTWVGL